jgi:hypothetical protein
MKLWKDTLTVAEYQEVTKPNMSTGFAEVNVLENEPCKLSFSTLDTVNQNYADAVIIQSTKLFCDNALTIKAGSKITIQHAGRSFEFSKSGEAGVFSSHQEIELAPFRGWA